MGSTPVWILLKTVFQSILQVFLICLAGWYLARRGILDKKLLKQLNRLNISIFTPALLFSKVAFSLSAAKLRELWVMPVFFLIVTFLSFAVAQIIARFMGLSKMQRNFTVAACMFMNSNSLPVALMQSLVTSVPHLRWGDDDNSTAMLGRALTYLVLHSSLGMILRWSYGVFLLSGEEDGLVRPSILQDDGTALPTRTSLPPGQEGGLVDLSTEDESSAHIPDSRSQRDVSTRTSITAQEARRRGANPVSHLVFSFPNTPLHSQTNLKDLTPAPPGGGRELNFSSNSDGESGVDEPLRFASRHQYSGSNRRPSRKNLSLPMPASAAGPARRLLASLGRHLMSFLRAVEDVMTPPLYASVLSLLVALIPPLQDFLDKHTLPLKGALKNAGECSIPMTLVVLGGYFYTPQEEKDSTHHQSLGTSSSATAGTSSQGIHADQSSASAISLTSNIYEADISGTNITRPGPTTSIHQRGRSLISASWAKSQSGETKTVFAALISRMLIVPVLMFPLFWLSTVTGWQDVFTDPVFVISCILLASSPPAVTLAQIVPKSSGDAFERLIARTIFWGYCVLTPPAVIIYVVLGLWFSKV